MLDEAMRRLLDYDRRRYWLVNGWSIRIRVGEIEVTPARPQGIKYAFTLHDIDGTRLLGFDNALVPRGRNPMTTGIASDARRILCLMSFVVQTN